MSNLNTTYLGLNFKNPLIAASSGLTGSIEKIKELADAGIAGVVIKSLFEEQILNEVAGMVERDMGSNSFPGAEDYLKTYLRDNSVSKHLDLVAEAKKTTGLPVIASINCISSSDWTSFAAEFEKAGADALELNIFFVPMNKNQKPGETEQMYVDILTDVMKKVTIPVSVKFGPYHSNIIGMANKLLASGAKGVVMFNRFYEPDFDLETLEITHSEVFSSPGDIRRSLRWIGLVSAFVPQLDIAASTGIHDSKSVIKMLLAGANVTQLCSTLYLNGSAVIGEILKDLNLFMEKWNFNSPDDFRGRLSYKNTPDPAMYERSQFMRYFSSKD